MLRVLLVRPGATEYDRQGRIRGNLDIPLCSVGREQVDALVKQLDVADLVAVYHDPCQAAEETAQAIAAIRDVKLKSLDALTNLDHGLWQGLLLEEVRAKQPKVYRKWQEEPEVVCPPQGETVPQARARVEEALRKLARKHKAGGTVGLVVANPLASIVRHLLMGGKLADNWSACNQTAGWELLDVPQPIAPAK